MKKLIIAAGAAAGLAALTGIAKLAMRGKPTTGNNRHLAPAATPAPADELLTAANAILAESDKIVDAESAFVTRNPEGGLELYGQVTSSAAAGALKRRIAALDPDIKPISHFKVAKRA